MKSQKTVSLHPEHNLFASDTLATSIIFHSSDAIVCKDLQGIIRLFNTSAELMFGYSAEEVIGRPVTILIPEHLHHEEKDLFDAIKSGNTISHYETKRRRKDGTLIDVSLALSPIKDKDNRIIGASKTARDISARIEHDRMASQRNAFAISFYEQREEFMALVTHDLKNPLLGSNRVLDALMNGLLGPLSDQQHKLISQLKSSNDSLLDLLQNIIGVYRLERTTVQEAGHQSVSLPAVVSSAVSAVAHIAEVKDVTLSVTFPERTTEIRGDDEAIKRALWNLLDNAIKFTPVGEQIEVRLREDETHVTVEVEDKGPGISLEDQAQLFRLFGRGIAGKSFTAGTGLGLFYCKKVMDVHGGSIGCRKGNGGGSVFYASFLKA